MSASTTLPSTQPYYIRALHEWCTDNGFTPYLSVKVDGSVKVPMVYVQNGEIVLNASYDATSQLTIGNEYIAFQARFGGAPQDIIIPINRVQAIFARENGQGMGFEVADAVLKSPDAQASDALLPEEDLVPDQESADQVPAALAAGFSNDSVPEVGGKQEELASTGRGELVAVPNPAVEKEVDDTMDNETPPPSTPGAGKRPTLRRVK